MFEEQLLNPSQHKLIVDAKGSRAKTFYERHGFRSFQDTPLSLYLPLGS